MKTIVLTFKEGFKGTADILGGYSRIEIIPGSCLPNGKCFAFYDGEFSEMDADELQEASSYKNEDTPFLITYEEAKWIN